MGLFDDNQDVQPRSTTKTSQSGNNCDIFEPSVYVPESEKFRAEYIKRITAKVSVELDNEHAIEELPNGETPSFELEVTGQDPEKHLKFIAKYLRGPRGFNGSVDNFVVLTEAAYQALAIKDPNKFYYTYDGTETPGYVEGNVLTTGDTIDNYVLITNGQVNDNILTL